MDGRLVVSVDFSHVLPNGSGAKAVVPMVPNGSGANGATCIGDQTGVYTCSAGGSATCMADASAGE